MFMTASAIIRISIFILASIGIVYISRSSLRAPLTHGFPRFVVWESVLALFCIQVPHWFRNPFAIYQVFSWLFLIISILLIISGPLTLQLNGKPDLSRSGEALLGIEKTTALVTQGIYHYIRHPFYSSLLFLGWGIYLKEPSSWLSFILLIVVSVSVIFTALIEEREDIHFFGPAYRDYIKVTKKFIPYVY
jgi:protein-S-isoprenylcysteine O-methyltransferase Ste14